MFHLLPFQTEGNRYFYKIVIKIIYSYAKYIELESSFFLSIDRYTKIYLIVRSQNDPEGTAQITCT